MSYREPPSARARRAAHRLLAATTFAAAIALGTVAARDAFPVALAAAVVAVFGVLTLLHHLLDRKDPR